MPKHNLQPVDHARAPAFCGHSGAVSSTDSKSFSFTAIQIVDLEANEYFIV